MDPAVRRLIDQPYPHRKRFEDIADLLPSDDAELDRWFAEIVDARDKAWGGEHFRQQFNRDNPSSAKIKRQAKAADDALIDLARTAARPYPYRFEIRKAPVNK